MKKTIIIMMMILSLPIVFALYGGDTWHYNNFTRCKELKVNITAIDKIDLGEYNITSTDCIKDETNNWTNKTNYWICNCEDGYNFKITTKINTINNYTFNFNYAYSKVIEEQQSSGGSGSSSSGTSPCFSKWECTEWSNCKPGNKATRECTNLNNCYKNKPKEERYCYYPVESTEPATEVIEPIEVTTPTEPPIVEELEAGIPLIWWIIIGVFIVIAITAIIFIIKSRGYE